MGLDLSAFSCIVPASSDDTEEGSFLVYAPDQRLLERLDGVAPGRYVSGSGDVLHVRVGSYGYYNIWRDALASLVGVTCREVWNEHGRGSTFPFRELIDFSDCEGSIGPKTSAKLAKDFEAWEERAKAHFEGRIDPLDSSAFFQTYRTFRSAFEAASSGGVVRFH